MKIYRQSAGGKKPAAVLKRPAAVLKRPAAVLKRPAAVLKRPAAILKKRAACEAVLGTSEEEDVEARPAVAIADPEPAAVDLASPESSLGRLSCQRQSKVWCFRCQTKFWRQETNQIFHFEQNFKRGWLGSGPEMHC